MAADHPYRLFRRTAARMTTADVTGFAAHSAGRFARTTEAFTAVPLPGCTVLAEPYPIDSVRTNLCQLQEVLVTQCPHFAPVPAETFHLTVADLLAGAAYVSGSEAERHEVCARAQAVLYRHRLRRPIRARIYGVGMFPAIVVAVVELGRSGYRQLAAVRADLYRDLHELSVRQQFAFAPHVTLGYLEPPDPPTRPPTGAESAVRNARALSRYQRRWWRQVTGPSVKFEITGWAVYRFPDLSHYAPLLV